MADSLDNLKEQYQNIKEFQSEMRKSGLSASSRQMKDSANQLGKLGKKIEKLEKGR
ncbi:hypothetical protein [Kribbella italica]|uniref:Ribosomal 50S subunit-associated protein YjgA (DUF615 family) n=1 Tax=Kribbella italica TaxID=1540520 RepID=A0A7W9JD04_9ACTN|nr:hypothetical protein [Kribbella italica]MBB5839899.1 ribosomal 50S subunit-associated protein YjgA (DUF615 family) [Kribbella italica]